MADLDDIFEGGALQGKVKQGITYADVNLDFLLQDDAEFVFNPEDSSITVTDGNGNTIGSFQVPENDKSSENTGKSIFPITVKDKEGNIYEISPKEGTSSDDTPVELEAVKVGKEGAPIQDGSVDLKNPAHNKAVVTFKKAGKYAFDEWNSTYATVSLIRDKYEKLGDTYVPFKLLPPGKTDIVQATIDLVDNGVDPNKVIFKTSKGTEFKSEYKDGIYTIMLTGGVQGDGQEVYALYPGGQGYYNLGKLIVVSYPERTINLTAVGVNGANVDIAALSNKLNEIYNPLGIIWKVTGDTYSYTGNTQFMEKGSGLLSAYPAAMKEFNGSYAADRDIDNKTGYLFFFDQYGAGGSADRNADGFMPRNKQFGYLFTKGFNGTEELYAAAAHELGHGMFVLKHTFDNSYKIPQGITDNLMDYTASATHVAKWQWDLMHDNGVVIRVFEKDGDAMKYKSYVYDSEYLVRNGKIVAETFYFKDRDYMKKVLSTETVQQFLKKLSNSNINTLIFEIGGPTPQASTLIGFVAPSMDRGKEVLSFRSLKDVRSFDAEKFKKSSMCVNIYHIPSMMTDHHIAHEIFIHDLKYIEEVNKLDIKSLSQNELCDELEKIQQLASYKPGDGGDRDHYLFIAGEKEKMTKYTLERLGQMKTDFEKLDYLRIYVSEICKYIDKDNHPGILEHNGGYKKVVAKAKSHLETDFYEYKKYIFEPLNKLNLKELPINLQNSNKTQTLWEIYIKPY